MTILPEQGERLVAAAKPGFKDFRADFEKISSAASKAARESRDGLDPAARQAARQGTPELNGPKTWAPADTESAGPRRWRV